ncbi:MAG: ATP-binding cassette domain-containing protein [Pseudomonadales bacterium]
MIEAQALQKNFGSVAAVRDVSFTAANGSITALLGPNGAGKSTTFRMLATVIGADSGCAKIDGIDVAEDPLAVRGKIAVLPHDAGIYARLTARENVRYFGKLHGLDDNLIEQRLTALIERLDMGDFCDRRTAGFSQGQKVKVALARALIHDPSNVILDEPTNGLDVMATRSLREIIRNLRDEGRCVLFSSHIMQEVSNLCDQLVVIDEGIVKYDGSLEGLRTQTGERDLEEAFIRLIDPEAAA